MNDVIKALSRVLEPLGYRIRPSKMLNFLKIAPLERGNQDFENIKLARQSMNMDPLKADFSSLTVFLRTCMKEKRTPSTKDIPGGATLEESIVRSIHSLVRSICYARDRSPALKITLNVLDDRSDQSKIALLTSLIAPLGADAVVRTTDVAGQGASLHQAFSEAREREGLVYFVEDDYLHEEDAIFRLCEFYQMMALKMGTHMVLYPQEHPTIYNNHYPSYIVIGADRHWRSIRHATHTLFMHAAMVRDYWRYFENTKFVGDKKKRQKGSEAKTTNLLFQHLPGFSPLRPCAVHFQGVGLLPPLYDWRALWERSRPDISAE